MSSFLKQGQRKSTIDKITKTKKHVKHFYKTLHELDLIAQAMIQSGVAITVDNVVEEASKYTTRTIDKMEQNILMSKITGVYDKLGIKTNTDDK